VRTRIIAAYQRIFGRRGRGDTRERELRRACTALVAATHRDEVTAALSAATIRLLPPGTGYAMAGLLTPGRPVVPDPEQAGRRTTLAPVSDLPDPLRTALAPHEYALSCPLLVDFGPGRRGAAQWLVAGRAAVLAAARDAFEVLAAQAALALERIELTEAMYRLDCERYLRTVIETTSDVVLVVNDEERIRFASRSMARALGIEPPVSGLLADIVHPDDHPRIRETRERAEGAGDVGAYGCWNLRRADGSPVVVEVNYRDLRGDRMVRGFVLTMRDITERRHQETESTRRALAALPAGQNRQSANRKFR
jgi:PAS domain S-box-containing protein